MCECDCVECMPWRVGGVHDVCWCCVQGYGGGIYSSSGAVTVQSNNNFIHNTAQVECSGDCDGVSGVESVENRGRVSVGWK